VTWTETSETTSQSKPVTKLTKRRKEKAQINKIRYEKVDITKILMVFRRSYRNSLNTDTPGNWKIKKKIINSPHIWPTITKPRDINNLNRPLMSNEIETVIKKLPTKKSLDPQ
jgi:hypothetical protein